MAYYFVAGRPQGRHALLLLAAVAGCHIIAAPGFGQTTSQEEPFSTFTERSKASTRRSSVDLKAEHAVGQNWSTRRLVPAIKLDLSVLSGEEREYRYPNRPGTPIEETERSALVKKTSETILRLYFVPDAELPRPADAVWKPGLKSPDPLKSGTELYPVEVIGVEADPKQPHVVYLFYRPRYYLPTPGGVAPQELGTDSGSALARALKPQRKGLKKGKLYVGFTALLTDLGRDKRKAKFQSQRIAIAGLKQLVRRIEYDSLELSLGRLQAIAEVGGNGATVDRKKVLASILASLKAEKEKPDSVPVRTMKEIFAELEGRFTGNTALQTELAKFVNTAKRLALEERLSVERGKAGEDTTTASLLDSLLEALQSRDPKTAIPEQTTHDNNYLVAQLVEKLDAKQADAEKNLEPLEQVSSLDITVLHKEGLAYEPVRSTTIAAPLTYKTTQGVTQLPPGVTAGPVTLTGTGSPNPLLPPVKVSQRLNEPPPEDKTAVNQLELKELRFEDINGIPLLKHAGSTALGAQFTISDKNRDPNSLLFLELTPVRRSLARAGTANAVGNQKYTVLRRDLGLDFSPSIAFTSSQRLLVGTFGGPREERDNHYRIALAPFRLQYRDRVTRSQESLFLLRFSPMEWIREERFSLFYVPKDLLDSPFARRRERTTGFLPTIAASAKLDTPVVLGIGNGGGLRFPGSLTVIYTHRWFFRDRNDLFRDYLQDVGRLPVDLPQFSSYANFLSIALKFKTDLGIPLLKGENLRLEYRVGFTEGQSYFSLANKNVSQLFFGLSN